MKTIVLIAAGTLCLAAEGLAGEAAPAQPFEAERWKDPATHLDGLVQAAQRKKGVAPAAPCSDEVFLRRVFLDVIGTLPTPEEAAAFAADRRAGKRAALVDALFERPEFADHWALKWCDLLRVKSEFPINLWPDATQAYHRWIRDAVRTNMPYDAFARALLTSSGSSVREPAVNFFRAVQGRTPESLAAAAALTFMGERFEKWPAAQRTTTALFFSRVAWKKTSEWKEEIVLCAPGPAEPLDAFLPDGTAVRVPADEDPRRVFADWLVDGRNRRFTAPIVNRVWSWLFGRGLVHEPDDFRADNPAAMPDVLAFLERELVSSRFDLRRVFRAILTSRTYQQSSIAKGDAAQAEALFACYPVRRLPAEVLADALARICGAGEEIVSTTPEPWTFVPAACRAIELPDGSVTSPFLATFGRPARDTGLESERNDRCTDAQRLHLLNASRLLGGIRRSARLRDVLRDARGNPDEAIRGIYALVLTREPTFEEMEFVRRYAALTSRPAHEAAVDLVWALVNSKEFLFKH